jgi:hypothetical protein
MGIAVHESSQPIASEPRSAVGVHATTASQPRWQQNRHWSLSGFDGIKPRSNFYFDAFSSREPVPASLEKRSTTKDSPAQKAPS